MHSTLAFTPTGLPLGILAQQIWALPCQEAPAHRRTQRPIAEKKSYKWLAALQDTATLVPTETRTVTIADRETDIFEFLDTADHLGAEYVIRAAQDRRVAGKMGSLWAHMASQALNGTLSVRVAARPGQAERTADLESGRDRSPSSRPIALPVTLGSGSSP
jgi:hypothetical protein